MLPQREIVLPDVDSSFRFLIRREPSFAFRWHHHSEFELTWIASGSGTRFVGDDIRPFESGDLVLLGPELPHTWWSPGGGGQQEAFCVQFSREFVAEIGPGRPEGRALEKIVSKSDRGLQFSAAIAAQAGERLRRMEHAGGLARFGLLLECFDLMVRSRQRKSICTSARTDGARVSERVDAACRYVLDHLDASLRQPDVAAAVGMQPAPFARFFRRHTGRTLTSYIQHTRIARACALLRETDDSVVGVAYDSGFANLSNFNRVFKRLRGMTPREYRRRFQEAIDSGNS